MKQLPTTQSPQVAAFIGFILAATSAAITLATLRYWMVMAHALEALPPKQRSGGPAFAVNIPGFALELVSFSLGVFALMVLGGTLIWRPRVITSWFTIVGLLCLIPITWLVLRRCGLIAP